MLFRSQCYFFGVLIFLCFGCSTYIHCARLPDLPTCPRRQSQRREEKDRKELFCLSHNHSFQVTSVCLLLFMCCSWQMRWIHYFTQEKNWLLSLRLPVPFKHGLTPNVTLSSKHHPGPVPAGECQTVRCKALHPLKALHFKQSL